MSRNPGVEDSMEVSKDLRGKEVSYSLGVQSDEEHDWGDAAVLLHKMKVCKLNSDSNR